MVVTIMEVPAQPATTKKIHAKKVLIMFNIYMGKLIFSILFHQLIVTISFLHNYNIFRKISRYYLPSSLQWRSSGQLCLETPASNDINSKHIYFFLIYNVFKKYLIFFYKIVFLKLSIIFRMVTARVATYHVAQISTEWDAPEHLA